jgi:hypothetical protein
MNAQEQKPDLDLNALSDEEILELDPSTLSDSEEQQQTNASQDDVPGEAQSTDSTSTDDNADYETDGADSTDDSESAPAAGVDTPSAEYTMDLGTEEQTAEGSEQTPADDQSAESGSEKTAGSEDSPKKINYKAEYAKVMAPFKAAKRTIQVSTAEEIRRLAQMGVDYSRKMEAMKPYQRILKTLEKNDLLDPEKINFLIDLDKKNPEAIKKFLKDSDIDPMDLDLEDDIDYRPNDHSVSDSDIALDDVINDLRETPHFERTVNVITKEWDTASRKILIDNPEVIRYINQHMDAGIYEQIADRAANDKLFGRTSGLSDLEAYKQAGDALQAEGAFNTPNPDVTSPDGKATQGFSQDSGSSSAQAENLRNRKRAASPTKGNASARKRVPNFLTMSDEDIEKFDINSL